MLTGSVALNLIAAVLPWVEILCGLLLMAGFALRGAALLMFVMLLGFTLVVAGRAFEIYRAGALAFCAIRFDCGCGSGDVLICAKLIENAALSLLALAVLISPGGRPQRS